jgi:fermentation-respiration switch protein FrsA (DUF1100 family)
MRFLKKGFIFLASAVVLILIGTYFMQEKLIFLPTKLSPDYAYQFSKPFTELFLETEDGARLNAIHFKIDNPKGVILYYHGNAGDLSRWGEITLFFTELQYDVLVMDYRTYGKSSGNLSEEYLYKDAQLFYDYLLKSYSEEAIVVYGRSLGATFATYVAGKNQPRKLILETPFFNLTETAKKRIPIFPVAYFLKYQFPTNQFIKTVSCPIVIFHGTDDSVVDYKSGQRLSKLVPTESLNFVTIEGGNHNDLIDFEVYQNEIQDALK